IGVEPENNEIIYGLRHLSEALLYEKKAKNIPDDAELSCVLSASVTHEGLQGIVKEYIEYELESFVRREKAGRIFDAPYDVYLDNNNVFQPDIMFISKERLGIIGEKNVQGAPDLVVEILSESTAYNDLRKKKKLYAKFGVREYWIVDPGEKSVEIYSLEGKEFNLSSRFSMNDNLESPLLYGLKIELLSVFSYE
ncbi:hypothetical protein LCGC14_2882800, partial [marine sediment metagenome]